MKNLQLIKSNQQSKYDEIIEYLKQDNEYWLENDIWDLTKDFFVGKVTRNTRNINFSNIGDESLKKGLKFYIIYSFKENSLKDSYISSLASTLKHFSNFF